MRTLEEIQALTKNKVVVCATEEEFIEVEKRLLKTRRIVYEDKDLADAGIYNFAEYKDNNFDDGVTYIGQWNLDGTGKQS